MSDLTKKCAHPLCFCKSNKVSSADVSPVRLASREDSNAGDRGAGCAGGKPGSKRQRSQLPGPGGTPQPALALKIPPLQEEHSSLLIHFSKQKVINTG